jgi:hypothetical protein
VLQEPFAYDHSIGRSLLNSELKCLRTSKSNPGVKWSHHGPDCLDVEMQLIVKIIIVDTQGTSKNIGMATDIFGN